jgi:bacteriochlorophyll C8 methyltransferase
MITVESRPAPPQFYVPESLKTRPLKLLFIMPKGKKEEDSNQKALFSMAIAMLVSITPKQHEMEIVDQLFGDPIDYDGKYDLVCITARTMNVTRGYDIADEFRKRGTKVVMGGVHVSFNYNEAIVHCDSVIVGEAENLWDTVLNDVAKGTLLNRYDAKDFPPVNFVPMIDYERIFKASKRGKVDARKSIPIFMTRGCPYTCTFCVTPNFTGKLYRVQSADTIREQIAEAKRVWFKETKYGNKPWLMFTDENFGVNKQKMWEILEVLKECNVKFSTFISLNFLEDPKSVKLLVDAGCAMALVGFESINEETLKHYNKGRTNTIAKYEKTIRECRKAGLNIQGNFLVNPAIDRYEDMDAVETFITKNYLMMPIYSLITPYPGTDMYKDYKEKGLVVDEDWDKYTACSLVVKCEKYDPQEYQVKYMEHYLGFYSWRTIMNRVIHNPNKLLNFVTSIMFRRNLTEQLENVKNGQRAINHAKAETKSVAETAA